MKKAQIIAKSYIETTTLPQAFDYAKSLGLSIPFDEFETAWRAINYYVDQQDDD